VSAVKRSEARSSLKDDRLRAVSFGAAARAGYEPCFSQSSVPLMKGEPSPANAHARLARPFFSPPTEPNSTRFLAL
jgi:hypothetical protein